jgi:hypothetical protein
MMVLWTSTSGGLLAVYARVSHEDTERQTGRKDIKVLINIPLVEGIG